MQVEQDQILQIPVEKIIQRQIGKERAIKVHKIKYFSQTAKRNLIGELRANKIQAGKSLVD